jgi:hypothetical protein
MKDKDLLGNAKIGVHMPTAKVLFIIPEASDELAERVLELGGECEDSEDIAAHMATCAGGITSIVFSDCRDPIDDACAVTDLLKKLGSPYFAATDSFTEQSRGTRYQARLILNTTGSADGEKASNFPWENGEPDVNERSLAEAGFDPDDIKAMTATFYPDLPVATPMKP